MTNKEKNFVSAVVYLHNDGTRTLAIPAEQSMGSWLKQKIHKALACWKKYGAIYTIRKIWRKLVKA